MSRFLCLIVPITLLSGCFLSNVPGEELGPEPEPTCVPPAGMVCCDQGSLANVTPARSACPFACPLSSDLVPASACSAEPPSPPEPPVPITCEPTRAEFTCLDDFRATPGVPFSLPVSFRGVHCCAEVQCSVSVEGGETPQLYLTTALCPDDCDCDGGNPNPTGTCEVPALQTGEWEVFVNDAFAFDLPVRPLAPGITGPPPECLVYPASDACGSDPRSARPAMSDAVCVEDNYGATQLRVTSYSYGCGNLSGGCRTSVIDNGDTFNTIEVRTSAFGTMCDVDCTDEPVVHDEICPLPPLEGGGLRYNVVGLDVGLSFTLEEVGVCAARVRGD